MKNQSQPRRKWGEIRDYQGTSRYTKSVDAVVGRSEFFRSHVPSLSLSLSLSLFTIQSLRSIGFRRENLRFATNLCVARNFLAPLSHPQDSNLCT